MLRDIRNNYQKRELKEQETDDDPVLQFQKWMKEAIAGKVKEPTAMILSTVDPENRPHARVVLLKEMIADGFVFYTNYESDKALQIEAHPFVSLTFFWAEQERQVRIDGSIQKISPEASDNYFASRPHDSQLGAWASPQSRKIRSKEILEDHFVHYQQQFEGKVPRPPHWGGYLVKPYRMEFWQGRPNRLHDRICYLHETIGWTKQRLAP